MSSSLVAFEGKTIRREWVDGQWWYPVIDIIAAITDSAGPQDYWFRLKRQERDATGFELSTLCRFLQLTDADGTVVPTEAVNSRGAFRVIQAIPTSKAEPLRQFLERHGAARQ